MILYDVLIVSYSNHNIKRKGKIVVPRKTRWKKGSIGHMKNGFILGLTSQNTCLRIDWRWTIRKRVWPIKLLVSPRRISFFGSLCSVCSPSYFLRFCCSYRSCFFSSWSFSSGSTSISSSIIYSIKFVFLQQEAHLFKPF